MDKIMKWRHFIIMFCKNSFQAIVKHQTSGAEEILWCDMFHIWSDTKLGALILVPTLKLC